MTRWKTFTVFGKISSSDPGILQIRIDINEILSVLLGYNLPVTTEESKDTDLLKQPDLKILRSKRSKTLRSTPKNNPLTPITPPQTPPLFPFPPEGEYKGLFPEGGVGPAQETPVLGQNGPVDGQSEAISEKGRVPYAEILSLLNEASGRQYGDVPATRRFIKARWAEGYRLEDFKKVVDNMVKEWGNNPEMAVYLRPQTLFGTKFDSYLNREGKYGKTAKADGGKYSGLGENLEE